MNKTVHYIGLDVHKDSIAVAILQHTAEIRRYGIIGGTIEAVCDMAAEISFFKKFRLTALALVRRFYFLVELRAPHFFAINVRPWFPEWLANSCLTPDNSWEKL